MRNQILYPLLGLILTFHHTNATARAVYPSPSAAVKPSKLTGEARNQFAKSAARKVYRRLSVPDWTGLANLCESAPCEGEFWLAKPADIAGERKELHVVGAYEPSKAETDASGRVLSSSTKVKVQRADKPVVLYLAAYSAMNWKVEPSPGVKIETVYLAGDEKSVVQAPPGTLVKRAASSAPSPYSLRTNDPGPSNPTQILGDIQKVTGVRVASFQGNYKAVPVAIPLVPDQKLIDEIYGEVERLAALERTSMPNTLKAFMKDPRVLGLRPEHRPALASKIPPDARQVVWSPFDKTYYGVSSDKIFTMSLDGRVAELSVPPGVPGPTWLGGVAVDERSRRVYFVSTWHAGEHHAYDPVKKEWYVFQIEDNSATAVTFHKRSGRLYGVVFPYVFEYDEKLKRVRSWNLKDPAAGGLAENAHLSAVSSGSWVIVEEANDLMVVQAVDRVMGDRVPSEISNGPEVYFLSPATGAVRVASDGH